LVSKSRVRKAGERFRETSGSVFAVSEDEYREDTYVLREWRSSFRLPLTKAAMGLRSAVTTIGIPSERSMVAQRLKREPQIINKLCRFPGMSLDRMGDIAGCRAVLPSLDAVYKVKAQLERSSRKAVIKKVRDYAVDPQSSGYRAVHLETVRDERLIEIQLRTVRQQRWAEFVERLETLLRSGLKDGKGDEIPLNFLRLLGDAFADVDNNEAVSSDKELALQEASALLTGYLHVKEV
jgi:putative GTP pyrophosphokinase